MKELTLTALGLLTAASTFAQGTVNFNMRFGGTAHVYMPTNPFTTNIRLQGQGSNDGNPSGTTDYSNCILIGSAGLGNFPDPSHYLGQLLGANGAGAPESSLLPSTSPPQSFRTGITAGTVVISTATFNNIPLDSPAASFELVAWDNSSGLYPTWAQASVAWLQIVITGGRSREFTLNAIGGNNNSAPGLFPGLTSFNLFYATPEPTTAALAGMGAAALLIFRRHK